MKASELITFLSKQITDSGEDPLVYFDTEAGSFDTHLVEITQTDSDDGLVDGENNLILKCNNDLYIHEVRK